MVTCGSISSRMSGTWRMSCFPNPPIQTQRFTTMSNTASPSPKPIVYVEYDPSSLPPALPNYTRFVCIADTHSHEFYVPPGDVLLHGGDLTNTGTVHNFEKTMEWLYGMPHNVKVYVNFPQCPRSGLKRDAK